MMLLTLLLAVLGSAGVNLALLRSGLLSASKYFLPLLIISSLWALNGNIVPLSTVIRFCGHGGDITHNPKLEYRALCIAFHHCPMGMAIDDGRQRVCESAVIRC